MNRAEWDFSDVPDRELIGCCYWEYARESAFIRETLREYREWAAAGRSRDGYAELFARSARIHSLGEMAEVIVRGSALPPAVVWQSEDPAAKHYRHPEALPITGNFPAPWQSLAKEERQCRARMATERRRHWEPIARGHFGDADAILKFGRARAEEVSAARQRVREANPGKGEMEWFEMMPPWGLCPSLCGEGGREMTVMRIDWGGSTNEELVQAFRHWVKMHRPKSAPAPRGRGHKPGDWRADLTRLAVLRLLARWKPAELFAMQRPALPELWETKQFAWRKWLDTTKWHDARREAAQVFSSLFPFLPPEEKPLSWTRKSEK